MAQEKVFADGGRVPAIMTGSCGQLFGFLPPLADGKLSHHTRAYRIASRGSGVRILCSEFVMDL